MKEKIISVKDYKAYRENPFLNDLNIPLVPKSNMYLSKDKNIINLKTGEIDEDVLLTGKRKYVDGEQFVKIFVNEMKALFELSNSAQKIFYYMLSQIKYNDLLILDFQECLRNTGYKSKNPVFKALAELMKHEFIAKTPNQFVYWINPKVFYKGDRLIVVKEYRKAKHKRIIPNQIDLFKETKALQEKLAQKDTH